MRNTKFFDVDDLAAMYEPTDEEIAQKNAELEWQFTCMKQSLVEYSKTSPIVDDHGTVMTEKDILSLNNGLAARIYGNCMGFNQYNKWMEKYIK